MESAPALSTDRKSKFKTLFSRTALNMSHFVLEDKHLEGDIRTSNTKKRPNKREATMSRLEARTYWHHWRAHHWCTQGPVYLLCCCAAWYSACSNNHFWALSRAGDPISLLDSLLRYTIIWLQYLIKIQYRKSISVQTSKSFTTWDFLAQVEIN